MAKVEVEAWDCQEYFQDHEEYQVEDVVAILESLQHHPMSNHPVWLLRNAQEAMLDRCVSYSRESLEPRVGPKRDSSVGGCSSYALEQSEYYARRMVWC